ncbi:MAG: twin-arginine translocation signal domain-containing protein, partial [Deltaproteobacteria bacterium]|nr:twin-arginine translocation signal domain-containing protein [Deltaproteobacteria bacterium]
MAEITRRNFLKYSGAAGVGLSGGATMAENRNRVAFLETTDRAAGAKKS